MTDYSSLKVVELKELLKERSLPVSGKKADLIQRLEEADAAQTVNVDVDAEPEPAPAPQPASEKDPVAAQNSPSEEAPSTESQVPNSPPDVEHDATTTEATAALNDTGHVTVETVATPIIDRSDQTETRDALSIQHDVPSPKSHSDTAGFSQLDASATENDPALEQPIIQPKETTAEGKTASQEQSAPPPQPDSQADQNRRRKRSRTPAPTDNEIHKKLKSASGEVKVTLPEDLGTRPAAPVVSQAQPVTTRDSFGESAVEGEALHVDDDLGKNEDIVASPKTGEARSPLVENGHTDIESASHPPTNTLYVKNLKRPLQPAALQTHLARLASPSEEDQQAIIADFFIDKLRTHCFARFRTVDQASQARNQLHNQAWPDEGAREKLFVDFIPEPKFDEWVAIEDQSVGGKRYQVVYEKVDGQMITRLTDGSDLVREKNSKPEVATTRSPEQKPKAPAHDDRAKGFKTLDDLFQSTKARPQLYFLPVNQQKVDVRLRELAQGRGGGRANGDARYTFQDDTLVDEGPDSGLRLDRPRGFVGGPNKPIRYADRRRPDTRRY